MSLRSPKMWSPEVCAWLANKYAYDPNTGRIFVAATGAAADARIATNGYRMVRVTNLALSVRGFISAHRLAWCLAHGEFPAVEVDHMNREKQDNRLANLRLATRAQNHGNGPKKVKRTGGAFTSQYRGVHWSKKDRRWFAQINRGVGTKHLGSYRSEEDAARAYNAAAADAFGEFANLNQVA